MNVSIVVATSSPFQQCLPLIRSLSSALQSPSLLELVVVVNGQVATKSAKEYLEENGTPDNKVRVIFERTESLLAGRHRGFAETSGDIFSLLDDDVTVREGWFSALVEAFENPRVALVGGPSFPVFAERPVVPLRVV